MAGPNDGPSELVPDEGCVVGIDLGAVRIGVAATDSRRTIATPRSVLARSGSEASDHRAIATIVDELGATLVVIGLPISLDGRSGPAARRIAKEVAAIEAILDVPVVLADERFSTVEAIRRRREVGAANTSRGSSRQGGGRRGAIGRARARPIDAEAAAVILQQYIDSARHR